MLNPAEPRKRDKKVFFVVFQCNISQLYFKSSFLSSWLIPTEVFQLSCLTLILFPSSHFLPCPLPLHSADTPLQTSLHCSKPPPPLLPPGATATPEKLYYEKNLFSPHNTCNHHKTCHAKTGHHMCTKQTINSYSLSFM